MSSNTNMVNPLGNNLLKLENIPVKSVSPKELDLLTQNMGQLSQPYKFILWRILIRSKLKRYKMTLLLMRNISKFINKTNKIQLLLYTSSILYIFMIIASSLNLNKPDHKLKNKYYLNLVTPKKRLLH